MSFKERYQSDPDFRAKHLEQIKKTTECECGCLILRCNMGSHRKTNKHKKLMDKKQVKISEEDYNKLVEKIKSDLKL